MRTYYDIYNECVESTGIDRCKIKDYRPCHTPYSEFNIPNAITDYIKKKQSWSSNIIYQRKGRIVMSKKWKIISELLERLGGRNFHDFLTDDKPKELEIFLYAPHIGCRAWIFEYKGVYMCFMDQGDGWWSFYSAIGYLDVIIAKYNDWKSKREAFRCLKRK